MNNSDSAIVHAIRNQESAELDRHQFRFGSGASLILIVLVIISIICFAALSIVSARADDRLTDRYVGQTENYQNAYNQGQDFIARTDADLHAIYRRINTVSPAQKGSASGSSASSAGDPAGSTDAQKAAYFQAASQLDGAADPSDADLSGYDALQEVLQNTDSNGADTLLVFTDSISDTQEFLLVLEPLWPDDHDGAFYQVLSAKVITTASYDYDTTLNVLK